MTDRHGKSNGQGQGMNWIRPEKRLAIYLRDGMACCYCGKAVEESARLTLDHLRPYSKGGSNEPTNLVTCCHTCNSARGKRSWRQFAETVAKYLGIGPTVLIGRISAMRRRRIDVSAARDLIARRGGFRNALAVRS